MLCFSPGSMSRENRAGAANRRPGRVMSNSNHNGMWARSLDGVSHDVRLALRMLSRSPGLSRDEHFDAVPGLRREVW